MRKIINGKMYNTKSAKEFVIGIMEVVIVILTSVKKHYSARELENFFCMDQAVLVVNTVDPVV